MKFLWVFDSDAVYTLIPICAALWGLGGSGPKVLRRLGVGFVIGLSGLSLGLSWWLCLIQVSALFGVTSLPYGDKLHKKLGAAYYLVLFAIGGLFGASLLPLAFLHSRWLIYGLMCGVSAISFGLTTLSSQKLGFPTWKFCEMITGGIVGLSAALFLS